MTTLGTITDLSGDLVPDGLENAPGVVLFA